jgi:hypothetical protein
MTMNLSPRRPDALPPASATLLLCLCLGLGGCTSMQPAPITVSVALPPPAPIALEPAPAPELLAPLLNYHQGLRRMTQGELLKELASLGQQTRSPQVALQMAMALTLTRGNGDLARAQALYDSVATSADNDAAPFKPLALLLSAQCADARRQAEHIDRLSAQLKENQRRNDQLSETLEALKAIERAQPGRPAGGPGSNPGTSAASGAPTQSAAK